MRRGKRHEEQVNHHAWAIPYADLMTLLLAFFVVMYAVSVVNEGKFRVMSASIVQAFNGSNHVLAPMGSSARSMRVVTPMPVAAPGSTLLPPIDVSMPALRETAPTRAGVVPAGVVGADSDSRALAHIEREVRQALQPLIDKQWVTVRRGKDWLEIEIRTDILFPSGVAQLSASADRVLQRLAGILAPLANPLRVEGFTDNVPISTPMYPSNWELSAARAASVARLFARSGVQPGRMGIVGWGDVKPVADNATADGRNRNRRVLVLVMAEPQPSVQHRGTIDPLAVQPGRATADNTDKVLPRRYAPVPAITLPEPLADRLSTVLAAGTHAASARAREPGHEPGPAHAQALPTPLASAAQRQRPSAEGRDR